MRCSTHSCIWRYVCIIAYLRIVFDDCPTVHDDPGSNSRIGIDDCPRHDHCPSIKLSALRHFRGRMNQRQDFDSASRASLVKQLPAAVFSDPKRDGDSRIQSFLTQPLPGTENWKSDNSFPPQLLAIVHKAREFTIPI